MTAMRCFVLQDEAKDKHGSTLSGLNRVIPTSRPQTRLSCGPVGSQTDQSFAICCDDLDSIETRGRASHRLCLNIYKTCVSAGLTFFLQGVLVL